VRRFRRRRTSTKGARRALFWDGVHAAGQLQNFNLTPTAGEASQYVIFARWPAGETESTTETGIVRSGLIQPIDVTLERTRVGFAGMITNLDQGTDGAVVLGIAVVEEHDPIGVDNLVFNTSPANPAAFANPAEDYNEDWVWRSVISFVSFTNFQFLNLGAEPDLYQSRAKRKLRAGQGLLFSIAAYCNNGDGIDMTLDFSLDIRMLFKAGAYRT
jgi:hypothetical protein